jgi:hypothetical protein
MPSIVPYDAVLKRLTADGLRCVYPNGGSFRPVDEAGATTVAWVGPPDGTIKDAARALCRQVAEPYVPNLAWFGRDAWLDALPGPVWVMPSSHWSYELDFDSATWLPELLFVAGVDSRQLKDTTQGAAIEFAPHEADRFEPFLVGLLNGLDYSDFYLAFPGHATVCIVHHHKQLWWTAVDANRIAAIERARVG